jgi:holliday junction DNA helicase RuvA
VPGIGKKTAERLLLELRGRLGAELPTGLATTHPAEGRRDIAQALVALGYSERDADAAVKALPADIAVSDGIKAALRSLAR